MLLPKALTALLIVAAVLFTHRRAGTDAAAPPEPQGRRAVSPATRQRTPPRRRAPAARRDYTKFSHRTEQHRLACDRCHKVPTPNWPAARAAGESFPDVTDYPDHPSCTSCHRREFFTGARPPICSVCHTNVSPRDGARFVFRNPGPVAPRGAHKAPSPTQFATIFPHDIHQDVMARLRDGPGSDAPELARPSFRFARASLAQEAARPARVDGCTVCHRTVEPRGDSADAEMSGRPAAVDAALWPNKGTFKTSPEGHDSCFNCHWREGGVAPLASDCAGCHKLLTQTPAPAAAGGAADADATVAAHLADASVREKFLRRESARFLHEEPKHAALGCTSCHVRVASISTLDPATLKVPLLSCGGTGTGCHIGATQRRILNVEVQKRRADAGFACAKCHMNFGARPLPESHSDAVPPPRP